MPCSVTGGVKLLSLACVFNELLNPETVKLRALTVECNHSPPIWNNEVWRVIVEQVASWESLQDCTWHAWCVRAVVLAWMRTQTLANICRLNPINANSIPKWHLQQRNEKFSRNLRLIISCKFAVMPVIRGDGTVESEMKGSQQRAWALNKP